MDGFAFFDTSCGLDVRPGGSLWLPGNENDLSMFHEGEDDTFDPFKYFVASDSYVSQPAFL
jgi:hypothetical protein